MSLKCGIVGLPNVGKSMLFNILTKSNVPSKNFPFCTIEPNIGISVVEDYRIDKIAKIVKSKNIIKSYIKCVDIAGLIKNSYLGDGLGNKFLENIKNVDVILHVVRFFKEENIIHVNNKVDPVYDVDLVNTELILSDYQNCKKYIKCYEEKIKKKKLEKSDNLFEIFDVLNLCLKNLKKNIMLNNVVFSKKQKNIVKIFNFITNKPVLYIANISIKDFVFLKIKNKIFNKLINFPYKIFPICINFNKISLFKNNINYDTMLKFFLKDINKIIYLAFNLLNMQTFFTVGDKEIRAWIVKKGITAIDASNIIHTDFKKGFIRARVISYKDFLFYKSIKMVKKFGKYRLEGKNYILSDGDIIYFLFNV
ncbi:redox-regulated ATPase YchF [Buchnera aphidicola]|uniref:redox-regulated ATPase YchF n=1 Tax=Buchnera aphidicola TaxID=9 RepID=UPI0031B7F59A